jgi:DNA mismatch endonuclease (patch repair protein)
MADVHTKEVRSFNMSQIRAKNTKPELVVRKYLFANGFRYRLHCKELPGKPDIVLPKYRTVIFVHGCFWHGHAGCKYYVVPKTKTDWWLNKISRNIHLDEENLIKLKQSGWDIITLFECELKKNNLDATLRTLINELNKKNIK